MPEEVTIRLEKDSYTVEGAYHFSNPQNEARVVTVGFPKLGSGFYPEFKGANEFLSFETRVDGKPVAFEEYRDSPSLDIRVSHLSF